MSKRDNLLLVQDMRESCLKILKYTEGIDIEEFLSDDKTLDAVVRNFEVIGEAANRVSDDFKSNHPEIEWNKLRGFRNRLIHEYFGVDYEIVWEIIESEIPELEDFLEQIENANSK